MKFEELPEKMQKGLLKGTRKTLVISTIIICAFFLGIAALIASFGHNMWVLAIFPLLVAVVGIVNLFIELKAPSNWVERSVKNAEYSFSTPSASESN